MSQKPTYTPGSAITLSLAQWYGISCMLDGWDTELGQYIADEIATETLGGARRQHTIFGLTAEECETMYSVVNQAAEALLRGFCKKAYGFVVSQEEENE